jgi:hypothetical protein
MVRDYSVMIIPSKHSRGFQIHLAPWMSQGPVPANYYQSHKELISALGTLRINPDVQVEIMVSMERGELYHIPSIELPDELAAQFGWNFS